MSSPLVATLAAPIRRVQELVGPGWTPDPGGDPARVLGGVRDQLADVAAAADRAWRDVDAGWSGAGAGAAAEFAATTSTAIDGAADRAARLGASAQEAAAAVARAHTRLRDIVAAFEAKAAALEPHLDSPGVARELLAAARDALGEAIAVVEELDAELGQRAAELPEPPATGPAAPAATSPAGFSPGGGVAPAAFGGGAPPGGGAAPAGFGGGGLGGGLPGGLGGGLPGGFGGGLPGGFGGGGLADLAESAGPADTPDAASFGEGVAVRLPDGTVVVAPNPVAAGAVRHALTQLGVPYQWGGTSPGVGLDCSGLTQWAYHQAGLDLPRLAQEQDVGSAVAPGALLPGDLAVWDGHVAMVVGDGTMIEAGDPVQLSPIRTTNAGQGFQGFWRPTA